MPRPHRSPDTIKELDKLDLSAGFTGNRNDPADTLLRTGIRVSPARPWTFPNHRVPGYRGIPGFILTNNHVVDEAVKIEVKLAGMGDFDVWLPAKVVGTDALTDSALLQLTALPDAPLPVSRFGDSAQLAQGDWVMAIGNPFSLSNTVTVGVISAVGRLQPTAVSQRFEEMIQTDAAINRGNSGGPLLNIRGEVVGMNTQIVSDQGGGNLGIGFAVPVNTIRDILPQLQKGKVVRGRIGVSVSRIPMTKGDAIFCKSP